MYTDEFIDNEAIMEAVASEYENAMTIIEYMHAADAKENAMIQESSDMSDIETFQEGAIGRVKDAVLNALKKFKDRISSLWNAFIKKVTNFISKKYTAFLNSRAGKYLQDKGFIEWCKKQGIKFHSVKEKCAILNKVDFSKIAEKIKAKKLNMDYEANNKGKDDFDLDDVFGEVIPIDGEGGFTSAKVASACFNNDAEAKAEYVTAITSDPKRPFKILSTLKDNLTSIIRYAAATASYIKGIATDAAGSLKSKIKAIAKVNGGFFAVSKGLFSAAMTAIMDHVRAIRAALKFSKSKEAEGGEGKAPETAKTTSAADVAAGGAVDAALAAAKGAK